MQSPVSDLFDLLEIVWHQPQRSIVIIMQLWIVLWTKMHFAMSDFDLHNMIYRNAEMYHFKYFHSYFLQRLECLSLYSGYVKNVCIE